MRTARLLFALCAGLALLGGPSLSASAQAPPPAGGYLGAAQLQALVAPIALNPDPLVAQILVASTYPSQITEADSFLQSSAALNSQQLASAVNQQGWDPSVMALTEYPSVLANLDQNLAWTSALGDAYYNQPDDVMAAIQTLRLRALAAGTLISTPQLTVINSGGIITLEPGNPALLYVPSYDAWTVYGAPIAPWPGYYLPAGVAGRRGLTFGIAFNLGIFNNYGWAASRWRPDWQGRRIVYNNQPYVSHSPTFFNRGGIAGRPPAAVHGGARYPTPAPPVARGRAAAPSRAPAARAPAPAPAANPRAERGFSPQPTPPAGTSSSAFSGVNHAAVAAGNSARGRTSLRTAPPAGRAPAAKPAPGRGPGGAPPKSPSPEKKPGHNPGQSL